jgi:hypothetical protein
MSAASTLRDEDAVKLGELLEFLPRLDLLPPQRAGKSPCKFTSGGYTIELRPDLARLGFLLPGHGDRR